MTPFLRFALVGAAGFVVDAATLYTVAALGTGWLGGRVLSYLAAATFTWGANRRFTFAVARPPSLGEWARFLVANAGGGLVNLGTYSGLLLGVPVVTHAPVLGVAAGSLAGLVINYMLSRRFVFSR